MAIPMTTELTPLPDFLMPLAITEAVTWNIATFGAIAEFSRGPGESGNITSNGGEVKIVTPRGALRFRLPSVVKIIAYEGLSKDPRLWSQGISLCLPEQIARMSGATIVTEVGHDTEAVHLADRECLMFDIGVGAPHVDAYVRTSDEALIAILRNHAGHPLFKGDPAVLNAILSHSPDRVFVSPLGRIEVTTPIAHVGGETETGPHTHVLPELLARGRTHAANVPIPDGYLPCLNIFPANPVRDDRGDARVFAPNDHAAFQDILAVHGDPAANAIKQQVRAAVTTGHGPGRITAPKTRTERTALRVTLRQLGHTLAPGSSLNEWQNVYEPNDGAEGSR